MNLDIYQRLKNRILFLEYKPAQILNEKTLAEEFNVSRTPLREVLNRLEWDQLVRVLPRSGTLVTEIEFQKMMHTYQVRFEIEEMVGRFAGEYLDSEDVSRLDALEKRCSRLLDDKDVRALVNLDIEFRDILLAAARNPVLKGISNQLYEMTLRLWYIGLDRGNWREEVQTLCDELTAIGGAVRENNPQIVGALRKEHLIGHVERIGRKWLSG